MLNFYSFSLNHEVLLLNQDLPFLCLCHGVSIALSVSPVDGVTGVAGVAIEVSDKLWLLCLPPELGEKESKSLVCS